MAVDPVALILAGIRDAGTELASHSESKAASYEHVVDQLPWMIHPNKECFLSMSVLTKETVTYNGVFESLTGAVMLNEAGLGTAGVSARSVIHDIAERKVTGCIASGDKFIVCAKDSAGTAISLLLGTIDTAADYAAYSSDNPQAAMLRNLLDIMMEGIREVKDGSAACPGIRTPLIEPAIENK